MLNFAKWRDAKEISFKDILQEAWDTVRYKIFLNQKVTMYTALPHKLKRGERLDPKLHFSEHYMLKNPKTGIEENFLSFHISKDFAPFYARREWKHITDNDNKMRYVFFNDPSMDIYVYKVKARRKHLVNAYGKIPEKITSEINSFDKIKVSKRYDYGIDKILEYESCRSRNTASAKVVKDEAGMISFIKDTFYRKCGVPTRHVHTSGISMDAEDLNVILSKYITSANGIKDYIYDEQKIA